MARLGRPGLTSDQKAELWRRWHEGEGYSDIGRAIGKFPASVFGVLRLFGGYEPAARHRSDRHLTLPEREEISRGLSGGYSIRDIAKWLNRSPSTISREIARNGGPQCYRATIADDKAWDRASRPKLCRLAQNADLRRIISAKLSQDWPPEQIAGWLKRRFPGDEVMRVSHETIYKSLFVQSRGVLKKELQKHLRTKRPFRQSKQHNNRGARRGQIVIPPFLISNLNRV